MLYIGLFFTTLLSSLGNISKNFLSNRVFYLISFFIFCIVALRYASVDYFGYERIYNGVDDFSYLGFFTYDLNIYTPVESGFALLIMLEKFLFGHYFVFIAIFTFISLVIKFSAFKKLSPYVLLSLLIYLSNEYFWKDLEKYQLIKNIKNMINKNHILNSRKDILLRVFKHFENIDYLSVNNMLPLQIEGLFHDYCTLIGIREKELNISSLNDKLDKLKEKKENGLRSNYEYFSFRFPVIRNKVAHGRYFESNDKLQTLFLIFDLFTVCEMIINPKIKLNKHVGLLRDEIDFEKMLEIARLKDFILPDFYQKEIEKLSHIKNKFKKDEFFEFLKEKISNENELGLKVLQKDIGYIKKYFVDKDNQLVQREFGEMFELINGRLIV